MPPIATAYTIVPVSRPSVSCIERLTSGASSDGGASDSSNAIAVRICGSPKTRPNNHMSTPAARPASMPRISSPRTSFWESTALVAGEAEQVPGVVHELVERHAREDRRRALFGADEVEQHDRQQRREQRVGDQVPEREQRDARC